MTGFGGNFPGLLGKDLQVLKEALPAILRVAVVATPGFSNRRYAGRHELDAAGSSIKLDTRWVTVGASGVRVSFRNHGPGAGGGRVRDALRP